MAAQRNVWVALPILPQVLGEAGGLGFSQMLQQVDGRLRVGISQNAATEVGVFNGEIPQEVGFGRGVAKFARQCQRLFVKGERLGVATLAGIGQSQMLQRRLFREAIAGSAGQRQSAVEEFQGKRVLALGHVCHTQMGQHITLPRTIGTLARERQGFFEQRHGTDGVATVEAQEAQVSASQRFLAAVSGASGGSQQLLCLRGRNIRPRCRGKETYGPRLNSSKYKKVLAKSFAAGALGPLCLERHFVQGTLDVRAPHQQQIALPLAGLFRAVAGRQPPDPFMRGSPKVVQQFREEAAHPLNGAERSGREGAEAIRKRERFTGDRAEPFPVLQAPDAWTAEPQDEAAGVESGFQANGLVQAQL